MMRRLDPKFDEGNFGYRSFTEFIKSHKDMLIFKDGENDQKISLKRR